MAYKAKKTTHSGAKHGRGAYWGPKADAKKESARTARRNDPHEKEVLDYIEKVADLRGWEWNGDL